MRTKHLVESVIVLAALLAFFGLGTPVLGVNRGVAFEPGDRFTGFIEPAGKADLFVFDAVEGELLTAKLTASKGSDLFPNLAIFDPDGTPVVPGAALSRKKSKITLKKFPLGKTGRYALAVLSDGATTGAYNLTTKAKLPKSVKLKNEALAAGAVRDIPFAGTSASTVKVSLKSKSGAGFTVTEVYDPSGADVPGALGSLVAKGSRVKGTFTLGQGTGLYGIRVKVGASAIALTAKITTKFPKPGKHTVALGATEPRVTSVTPSSAHASTTVTLDGENFTAATTVYFGDALAASSYVSPTRLTATIPPGTGTVHVRALGADGQGDALSGGFTYSTAGPTAAVAFPPPHSKTDAAALAVIGSAASPVGVTAVRVNGTAATSSDGFATWRAQVALALGSNPVTVETEDALGNVESAAARVTVIRTGPVLSTPYAFTLDSANSRVLLVDYGRNALYATDLASGSTTTLSDDTMGSGPTMKGPWAVAHDPANNRAFVIDLTPKSIYAIDLTTGDRTIVASDSVGTGTDLESPQDLVYDAAGSRVLVSDTILDAVVAVELATGNRTVISDEGAGIGAGPAFEDPKGLCLDAANGRVLVADGRSLVAVKLTGGDRTVISNSDLGIGAGYAIRQIQKVDLDVAGSRVYVVDRWTQDLVRIDLATGDRTVIGELPDVHRDVAYDPTGARPLVILQHHSGVGSMDPGTGAITWIHDHHLGTGPGLGDIVAMGFDDRDDRVLAVGRKSVTAVGYTTGNRTVLSDAATGTGDTFTYLNAGVIDTTNRRLFVLEQAGDRVFSVDIDTGDRTVFSLGASSTGPGLARPTDVVLDPAGNRLIVLSQQPFAVVAVDLTTGNRTLIADATTGAGSVLDHADGMDLDLAHNRILLVDTWEDALVAVDLSTGDRTVLSSAAVGTGEGFIVLYDVVLEPSGASALVLERTGGYLVRVDLATGNRTTASREDKDIGTGPGCTMPREAIPDETGRCVIVGNTDSPAILVVERESGDRVLLTHE